MFDSFDRKINEHNAAVNEMLKNDDLKSIIYSVAEAVVCSIKNNKKILLFGNGGSAADCQHIAAEFVGRFKKERYAYPAIALTVDTSVLTSISNDYSFDSVFSRQVEAIGKKGDVAVGISTSGSSKNVLEGLNQAKKNGLVTVLFCGRQYNSGCADLIVPVPSDNAETIQECHIIIGHFIAGCTEDRLEEGNFGR